MLKRAYVVGLAGLEFVIWKGLPSSVYQLWGIKGSARHHLALLLVFSNSVSLGEEVGLELILTPLILPATIPKDY